MSDSDKGLANILILLRAGNDPDTKQPHITWDEAEIRLNALIEDKVREAQKVTNYWNHEVNGTHRPKKHIAFCTCGRLPSYYASSGGFHYYGYYKCDVCNIFATGYHQFPGGIYAAMPNPTEVPKEPKLFVEYNDETNAEGGWNELIAQLQDNQAKSKNEDRQ